MERIVCGLSREFSTRGWNVRTIFPGTPQISKVLEWCHSQGVDAEASPDLLDAWQSHTWGDALKLRRFVKSLGVDIINIHYGDNFISLKDLVAIRSSGRHRCIVTVHHPTPWSDTGFKKRMLTALAGRLGHEVTTVSRATYEILRQAGISTRQLHIIPCGLQAPSSLPERADARRRLQIPAAATVIGTLGRLVPHKNVDQLIRAVAQLPNGQENVILVVAGDGPERSNLEQLAAEILPGRVLFLGRIPDVNEYLAALDIFALPSQLEGFGLVYVEAAFHGVPSVGTNVGGVPDAVVDGETGLLVPVGDTPALTEALQKLCGDLNLRRQIGEAARANAYTHFTEPVMANQYEQLFRRGLVLRHS